MKCQLASYRGDELTLTNPSLKWCGKSNNIMRRIYSEVTLSSSHLATELEWRGQKGNDL